MVPAFTGLGAPYWQPQARGLITGLTLDSNKDHIITAFLQSVAYQTRTLLQAMAADGAPVSTLRVDGGMVVNDAFCQFLCDLLNVPVERPADVETTVRGAGVLARWARACLPTCRKPQNCGSWANVSIRIWQTVSAKGSPTATIRPWLRH